MASIHRLTARFVATVKQPGLYADGGGLYLQVTRGVDGKPRRSWILRYTAPDGRRREMGLGSAVLIGLASARESAAAARRSAAAGMDPIDARLVAMAANRAATITFQDCADAYLEGQSAAWKTAKHRRQWRRTLEAYAFPTMGTMAVAKVDIHAVLGSVEPIWSAKYETARRVLGRIEAVLDWAAVRGLRSGDNPARWRGHLQKALPSIKRSARVRHHPALPFSEAPAFMANLALQQGVAARALAFCILTATRTGETIYARWNEFDLGNKVWSIPAPRMKVGREHRVPLTDAAIDILLSVRPTYGPPPAALVFPGRGEGAALSTMSLLMTLKRMGRADLTTHGFRSTFRDWAAEQTDFPREVAEAALAHSVGNAVEAAYRRGDLFKKRAALMNAWALYCCGARSMGPSKNR